MKIYVLVTVDLENYGFPAKRVDLFARKEDATSMMRKQYINACKKMKIGDPFTNDSIDGQFTDIYAYIHGEYYWDIFEEEMPKSE